jgi:hypothetical protein
MDWFDPEVWKVPAALAEHWQKIAGAVVVIGGAVGTLAKWGLAPVRWTISKVRGASVTPIQRQGSLRFVLSDEASGWAPAGMQQGTHVRSIWHVTNVSDRGVVLLKARLGDHQAHHSDVYVFGSGPPGPENLIPAHALRETLVQISFLPEICSDRKPLVADVIFTDNYGDEHRIPSVRFPYRGP